MGLLRTISAGAELTDQQSKYRAWWLKSSYLILCNDSSAASTQSTTRRFPQFMDFEASCYE